MFSFEKLNIIKNIPSSGGEGRIDLVKTEMGEKMVLKTICDKEFDFPEVRGNAVLEKYKRLKRSGLPVVPHLMVSKDEKQILMTDMTEGGRKDIFDKHTLIDLKRKERTSVPIKNGEKLREQIYEISQQAFEAGVMLDYDAYSLLIDKETGDTSISLIDIGENSFVIDKNDFINHVEEDAHEKATSFIRMLRSVSILL